MRRKVAFMLGEHWPPHVCVAGYGWDRNTQVSVCAVYKCRCNQYASVRQTRRQVAGAVVLLPRAAAAAAAAAGAVSAERVVEGIETVFCPLPYPPGEGPLSLRTRSSEEEENNGSGMGAGRGAGASSMEHGPRARAGDREHGQALGMASGCTGEETHLAKPHRAPPRSEGSRARWMEMHSMGTVVSRRAALRYGNPSTPLWHPSCPPL
jgi:hypothetical protein